jgi:hypothetical protein
MEEYDFSSNAMGDILRGNKTIHPIIYLKQIDEYYFIGCIITHSNEMEYKNNIAFLPEHFETYDKNNNEYDIVFDDSYFVKLELIKKVEWGPFQKVGELTNAGIKHIEKYLEQANLTEWEIYIKKSK